MTGKRIVSVVIPAYNAERFIGDAIKSCFGQTYRPVEVVVVNDGSTDSTVAQVNGLSRLVPDSEVELKLVDVGQNKGTSNALNVGFSNACGEYLCWLSADDMFVDKKKIVKQVECMDKTRAMWSYFKGYYSGLTTAEATVVLGRYLPYTGVLDPLFLADSELRLMMFLFRNPINGSSVMIKKNCADTWGRFDPITKNVDPDGDLWLRYSALNLKLVALGEATVFYREHSMQTSKKKSSMIYGSELTRMRVLLTLERNGDLTKLVKKFAPFFPVLLQTKQHLERPFVSEFLSNYILEHKKDFNRVLFRYIQKSLSAVKQDTKYISIDKNKFAKDLELFMKSCTFKKFEEKFQEMRCRGLK